MQVEAAAISDFMTSQIFRFVRAFVRTSTYGMYQRVNQKSGPYRPIIHHHIIITIIAIQHEGTATCTSA